jgi:hypothetical protein
MSEHSTSRAATSKIELLPYSITLSVLAEATLAVPSAKWTADVARWDAAFAPCSTKSPAEW